MAEINKDKSAKRLGALRKCAAAGNVGTEIAGSLLAPVVGAGVGGLLGHISATGDRPTFFHPNPQAAAAGLGAGIGSAVGYGANAIGVLIAALVARRKRKEQIEYDSKTRLSNFLPGVGAYNYTKRLGRVLGGVGETDEQLKAAEDRSAKRLETLKKCAERNFVKASEDRSAKRLETLKKCAASDRSAARRSILEKSAGLLGGGSLSAIPDKLNAAAGKLWGVTGKPLVRSVTGGLERVGDRVGGAIGRAYASEQAKNHMAKLYTEGFNAFNKNWQDFDGVYTPDAATRYAKQYIRNKQRSMATRQPMQMPVGSVPYQPK